jgi:outer membrane protein OmpA-like peptidoglycan-associated protein
MASLFACKAIVAITMGLGSIDLALVTLVLGPQVVHEETGARGALVQLPPPPVPAAPVPIKAPVFAPIDADVYFTTDSAILDTTARTALAAIADRVGDRTITLEGHADLRGPEAINLALSKQRATAVAEELVKLGVPRAQIEVGFAGATRAADRELWRDRRVDIHVGGTR